MLELCAKNRPTCTDLLSDPYFADVPANFKLDIGALLNL